MSAVEPAPADPTGSTPSEFAHCRNCRAPISGKFCGNCGQETNVRLPTLREFTREAAGRYVSFDGRFWRTLFALAFRPGRLTREYLAGRRRRFIRPARLYLFATLVFFAVSRFFVQPADIVNLDKPAGGAGQAAQKDERTNPVRKEKSPGFEIDSDTELELPEAVPGGSALKQRWHRFGQLSASEKEEQIADGMLRYGPYAMFALVPAFALLLKAAYVGRRRRYPHRPRLFGEHLVFAAHNHAFFFVAATAALIMPSGWLRAIVIGWIVFYLFRSLRTVYGGSRLGAIVRAFFLFVTYSVLVGLATAGLVVAAVLLR